MTEHDSVEWLRFYKKEISPLGEKVANILGKVYDGIYHADTEVLHKRVKWNSNHDIEFVGRQLNTYQLRKLLSGCDEKEVIIRITGASNNYFRIQFWHKKSL